MSEHETLQDTFRRLEVKQKAEEEAEISHCDFAEKMQGRYFVVTRRCKIDGCSCSNYSKAELVETCPTKKRKEREDFK